MQHADADNHLRFYADAQNERSHSVHVGTVPVVKMTGNSFSPLFHESAWPGARARGRPYSCKIIIS